MKRPSSRLGASLPLLVATLLVAGCPAPMPTTPAATSPTPVAPAPTSAPVAPLALAGQVTFRGEPLKQATLSLFDARTGAKAPEGRLLGNAKTGPDGRYALQLSGAATGEVYRLVAGAGASAALAGTFLVTESGVRALTGSAPAASFRLAQTQGDVNLNLDESTTALSIAAGGGLRLGASLTPGAARSGVEAYFTSLEAAAPELTQAFTSQATAANRVASAIDPATGWLKNTEAGENALSGLVPRAKLEAAARTVLTAYSDAAKAPGNLKAGASPEASESLAGLGVAASWGKDSAVAVRRADGSVKAPGDSDAFNPSNSGGSGGGTSKPKEQVSKVYGAPVYDKDGNLWVIRMSYSGTFSVLTTSTVSMPTLPTITYALVRRSPSGSETVVSLPTGGMPICLAAASSGDIWVGDTTGAVHCVRASVSSSSPEVLTQQLGFAPTSLAAMKGNTVWCAGWGATTTGQVARVDLGTNNQLSLNTADGFTLPAPTIGVVTSYYAIAYDDNTDGPDVWVYGNDTLYGRDLDSTVTPLVTESHALSSTNGSLGGAIAVTDDHAVWLTSGAGVLGSTSGGTLYRVKYTPSTTPDPFSQVSYPSTGAWLGEVMAKGDDVVVAQDDAISITPTTGSAPSFLYASYDSQNDVIDADTNSYTLSDPLPAGSLTVGTALTKRFTLWKDGNDDWHLGFALFDSLATGVYGERFLERSP